ncbi:MAG TPA: formate dehydrogenase [Burkholderiaceae bacterium]|nr:formate dehydrogenase [Burkholderiaceae bacterium]
MTRTAGLAKPSPAAQPLKRRGLLIGMGVAGAAAVAVKALPDAPSQAGPAAAAVPQAEAGGYQVSPHVLRYYETARA